MHYSLFQRVTMNKYFAAGGASSTFSLAPTKTLDDAGDIRADHPDVPAT